MILGYLVPAALILLGYYLISAWWGARAISPASLLVLAGIGIAYALHRTGRRGLGVAVILISGYIGLLTQATGLFGDANGLVSGAAYMFAVMPSVVWVCSTRRWQRLGAVAAAVLALALVFASGYATGAGDSLEPGHLALAFARSVFSLGVTIAVAHVFDLALDRYALRLQEALARAESSVVDLDARALELAREAAAHRATLDDLRATESRYRQLFDNAFDGIVIYDGAADRPLEINPSLARRLGYTAAELLELSLLDLSPEHQADGTPSAQARDNALVRLRSDSAARYPWRHRTRSGEFVDFELHTFQLRGPGQLRVSILRDVTEQLRAERELQAANRELRTFAHAASHDLKEPLRTMANFAKLLQRRYDAQFDEAGRQYIHFITDAATRGTRLVHDLLEYAEVGAAAVEPVEVDLTAIATAVRATVAARLLDEGARLEIGPLPTVLATPTWAQQLLQNLISNALKFKRPGVSPLVTVSARYCGPTVAIDVSDNGIGIDATDLERVFGVFTRLVGREEYEGNGIGLALCRRIMDQVGGEISVHSRRGVGTTFTLTFPAIALAPVRASTGASVAVGA